MEPWRTARQASQHLWAQSTAFCKNLKIDQFIELSTPPLVYTQKRDFSDLNLFSSNIPVVVLSCVNKPKPSFELVHYTGICTISV